jgi:hypothetical protein
MAAKACFWVDAATFRSTAREERKAFENMGILVGMRMHAAADAALDIYSPKIEGPAFGATVA